MKELQQEVMCVLLQTLLDKKLIPQDVYDQARNKILATLNWPEFFCHCAGERKEAADGSA